MKEQLLIKIMEMLLNSDSEISKENTPSAPERTLEQMHVGEYVLIRTYSSGVHFGKMVKRDGREVLLNEARRIWSWEGAFTLSKVASDGVGGGKFSVKIDGFLATEVIEIMSLTEKSKNNLYGQKDHE